MTLHARQVLDRVFGLDWLGLGGVLRREREGGRDRGVGHVGGAVVWPLGLEG